MKKITSIVIWVVIALCVGIAIKLNSVKVISNAFRLYPEIINVTGLWMADMIMKLFGWICIYFEFILSAIALYLGIKGRLWGTR